MGNRRVLSLRSGTFWFITFTIAAQWNAHVWAQEAYLCNDNIVIMAPNIDDKNRCNHVSMKPTTWDQAWDYCHQRDGWMVNCPSCSEGQGAYIGNELLAYNGVSSIWTGLHIRSERLIQDDFPTISQMGQLIDGWNITGALRGGQCVIEEYQSLDCGEIIPSEQDEPRTEEDFFTSPPTDFKRKRRSLPDQIPESCVPVYKQRIVPCSESHTFACYFSGIPSFFNMAVVRGPGGIVLFGTDSLDRRFYLTTEKGRLDESDDVCGRTFKGGRALRSESAASHRVILRALSTAVQTEASQGAMGISSEDLKRTLYWYHHEQEIQNEKPDWRDTRDQAFGGSVCEAALLSFSYSGSGLGEGNSSLTSDNFASMTWPCAASLPFLCELPLSEEETAAPVLEVDLGNFEFNDRFVPIKVVENEIQVSMELAMGRDFTLWCRVPEGFSESQSITIYRNGEPVTVVPYSPNLIENRIPIDIPDAQEPIRHMNLYHCQVNNRVTNQLINSNQMFVRITDMEVYALHVGVNQSNQNTFLWAQFYQKSLAGELDRNNRNNVVSRTQDAITAKTENWEIRVIDFIMDPSPRLVFYIYSFGFEDEVFYNEEGPDEYGDRNPDLEREVGRERVENVQKEMTSRLEQARQSIPEINLKMINVYSIQTCWSMDIFVMDRWYKLPNISGGAVWGSPQTCAQDGAPMVTVECEGNPRRGFDWGPVNVNPLCDYSTNETQDSEITEDLKSVSQEEVTKENVDEVLEKTKELTDQVSDSELEPIDVTLMADILQKSSEVDDLSSDQVNEILSTATRITSLDGEKLEQAQTIGKAASRLIKSVDDLGTSVQVPETAKFSRLATDKLALEVWDLTEDYDQNTIVGLKVSSDGSGEAIDVNDLISLFSPSGLDYGTADAAILLPKEFIEQQLGNDPSKVSVRLAMNVYADTSIYQATHVATRGLKRNLTLNSKVIAAKVLVNGVPITDLGPYNVTTVFLPKVKVPEEDRTRYSTCAWWDFDAQSGNGGWSSRGCSYARSEYGRDVCVCDHLTNFAVLVSFYDQDSIDEDHDLALGIISIVGLVLSIVGLSLSILSFLCIKKLRQGRPQQTLFNLSVALLLSWVVFLAGIGRTENHVGCIAVAAILHYLIMASFMWMLMEGILQYLLFVRVMNTYFTNYMVKTAVPAWGLPVIPVMVVLAIDPELYRGGQKYCWMSLDAFYYAFAIPVGAIILANLIIFVMVVFSLCRRKDMSKHSSQSSSQTVVNFRASFICFFILGLSWIFGFLTIEDARTVFQYIFCISASLQGFVIFLMMTARDKTVRSYWKNLCCSCCISDSQKQKTYRTWDDKGTGSTSNSGLTRHKMSLDNTTSQTNLSTSEHVTSSDQRQIPMDVKQHGISHDFNFTQVKCITRHKMSLENTTSQTNLSTSEHVTSSDQRQISMDVKRHGYGHESVLF